MLLVITMVSCQKEKQTQFENLNKDKNSSLKQAANKGKKGEKDKKNEKVQICHIDENGDYKLIEVSANAVDAHLAHGDQLIDQDGDGFTAIGSCTGSMDDCDDTDASVYPEAPELIDGIDNNCDGVLSPDEIDFDGDGYIVGTYDVEIWKTEPKPLGGGDLDDTEATIFPGAEEICDDGLDNNSNGVIDEDCDTGTGMFTAKRNGQLVMDETYKWVEIGSQIWMAENLKYLPSVVGPGKSSPTIPYYYVYDYEYTSVNDAKNTENYKTYGVLYNWTAIMAGEASSNANPSGVQGVCPDGWHLPSVAEWTVLTNSLGGSAVAGGKMKESGTEHWTSPNAGATNSSGFSALPGGGLHVGNETSQLNDPLLFENRKTHGWWWSTKDQYYGSRGYYYTNLQVNNYSDNTYINNDRVDEARSVRCVKD